jgi:two-component system, sensor histidine kinase
MTLPAATQTMDNAKRAQDNYDEVVKQNAIALLYSNMGHSAAALTLFPFVVLYSLWDEVEHTILLSWFGAACTVGVLRWWLYFRRKQINLHVQPRQHWHTIAFALSMTTGFIWGLSALLFFNHASADSFITIMIIAVGLSAGSAVAFNYWLPHFYAFSVPELTLIGLYFLFNGGNSEIMLAMLAFIYLYMLSALAQIMNRSFRDNLKLRLQNETLVDELRLEKDLAEAASRAKTRFLASASHDLRQPVHSLSLLREAMHQERDAARRKELLGLMGNSLNALDQLLGSLLDISKLDAGVVENKSEPTPLKPLLDALLNEVRPLAWDKGLKLRLRKCNYNVISDPSLLGNILRNLVTNAIRYTERGGVLVACRRKGEKLLIQIWDTGIGIAEKEQDNIFQEFIQLENQERDRNKGLGLGLAICRRMTYLLGHELSVKSKPGRGSVFTITLPVFEGNLTTMEKPNTTYSHWDLYGKRVLVLDDDETVRHGMLALLERWGCVTVSAADGDEAIARAREADYHFDVIVSDYRLPNDVTGVQVVREILAEAGWPIPVVLVTGDTSPERLKEAKASGYPLLHKPVKPAFLRNALGKVLAPKEMELKI